MLLVRGTVPSLFTFHGRKGASIMAKNMTIHKAKHAPGESTYERYLRTQELLSLQKPENELKHHDELQFQIVHQVFELWWKEPPLRCVLITKCSKRTRSHLPYACYSA